MWHQRAIKPLFNISNDFTVIFIGATDNQSHDSLPLTSSTILW